MKKFLAVATVIFAGAISQAASVTCQILDNAQSGSGAVLSSFRSELPQGVKSLARTEVAVISGVSFKVQLDDGQMTTLVAAKSGFSFATMSQTRKKKSSIRSNLNGLDVTFTCEHNKKS